MVKLRAGEAVSELSWLMVNEFTIQPGMSWFTDPFICKHKTTRAFRSL